MNKDQGLNLKTKTTRDLLGQDRNKSLNAYPGYLFSYQVPPGPAFFS